jgi:hypothetical protein
MFRTASKRKVLVESRLYHWLAMRQIIKMRKARETLQNIFFSGETWMDSKVTFRKY